MAEASPFSPDERYTAMNAAAGAIDLAKSTQVARGDFLPEAVTPRTWPGFYLGGARWGLPSPPRTTFADLTWETREGVIRRELEKNGIFLNEVPQLRQ